MASFHVVIAISFLLEIFVLSSTSIEMPPGCEGQQYCEIKPDNYPELDRVVSELQNKEFTRQARYEDEPKESISYDDLNCNTKVSIIKPYVVQHNATNKYVAQTNFFEQRIKQTQCLNETSTCFQGIAGMGSYNTSCTTTWSTLIIYLYDPRKDRIERVPFEFPVCCSCSLNE